MKAGAANRFVGLGTSLAVLAVALASALGALVGARPQLGGAALAATLTAIVIFAAGGTAGLAWCERRGQVPLMLGALFVVGGVVMFTSRGTAALLYYPLVSMGVLYLRALPAALLALATASVVLASWAIDHRQPVSLVAALFGYSAGIAFVATFSRMVRREHEQRAELARLNRQLRASAEEIETLAAAAERNRLAREIHDGLGHYLTVVHVQLEAADLLLERDPPRARTAMATARRLTREGLDDVRRSVAVLRGSVPVARSLPEALDALVKGMSGVAVELAISGAARALPTVVADTLFRAAQEALTNVQRHARANRVRLELAFADARVRLRVADDGVGAAAARTGGFGLVGLRERVDLAGGTFNTTTPPEGGFTVELELPC